MKKISRYFLMATVSLSMFAQNAFAEEQTGICKLISELAPVIRTLRILAFLGAAFVLMDWAWGFIKAGEVKKDDLKDKGIGMFVGFFLLFGVGLILTFVASTGGQDYLGCVKTAFATKAS